LIFLLQILVLRILEENRGLWGYNPVPEENRGLWGYNPLLLRRDFSQQSVYRRAALSVPRRAALSVPRVTSGPESKSRIKLGK
jgi:hypothetical protein